MVGKTSEKNFLRKKSFYSKGMYICLYGYADEIEKFKYDLNKKAIFKV